MKLANLHKKLSATTRPVLAMGVMFAIIDLHDKDMPAERLSVAQLIDKDKSADPSFLSNISKVCSQLQNMGVIKIQYRDKNGKLHDKMMRAGKVVYTASNTVIKAFGR